LAEPRSLSPTSLNHPRENFAQKNREQPTSIVQYVECKARRTEARRMAATDRGILFKQINRLFNEGTLSAIGEAQLLERSNQS
jgi:hypothetical protein